ncbi:hypothetical protein, partial [Escherichia coli]|uniref:hypothetical protein n=1 Tax=Escherichia coli TaxID=562 RepID=UPI001BD4F758
ADRNRSHWSTSKTPSYTKSVSWQHHPHSDAKSTKIYTKNHIDWVCVPHAEILAKPEITKNFR